MITCPDCGNGVLPDQPSFKSAADLTTDVERLRVGIQRLQQIALSGFRGDYDESSALSAINNTCIALLKD